MSANLFHSFAALQVILNVSANQIPWKLSRQMSYNMSKNRKGDHVPFILNLFSDK